MEKYTPYRGWSIEHLDVNPLHRRADRWRAYRKGSAAVLTAQTRDALLDMIDERVHAEHK